LKGCSSTGGWCSSVFIDSSLRIWESKAFLHFSLLGSSAHTGLVGLTGSSVTCSSDFICCSNWSWVQWDWLIPLKQNPVLHLQQSIIISSKKKLSFQQLEKKKLKIGCETCQWTRFPRQFACCCFWGVVDMGN
jgi:hypothetical protein